ncbi:hypothetical protein BDZ97DRAFT_1656465 [Flammula alnicola]|nr:hypothetical protein BDZ97DRAFT_1656465 [Flammula alnicola]
MNSFNPMMMVNTSGTCATSKLTQCRDFGCYEIDISRKFLQDPDNVPDLSRDEFMARKNVLNQVKKWVEKNGARGLKEWVPIAYQYEIVKASAKRTRDWGHLLFTDLTTTRFLIVMVFPSTCDCGNFSHHDYDAMTKYQADRLMSLLKYLHHSEGQPDWVRATYVTPTQNYQLDPEFLNSETAPSPAETRDRLVKKLLPIFHVSADNFIPSLLPSDIEKIENLLNMKGRRKAVPSGVRESVIGTKESRPEVGEAWKQKNARQCAYCEEVKEKDLMICSRCKLAYYCGRECQRLAWPSHKRYCKQA